MTRKLQRTGAKRDKPARPNKRQAAAAAKTAGRARPPVKRPASTKKGKQRGAGETKTRQRRPVERPLDPAAEINRRTKKVQATLAKIQALTGGTPAGRSSDAARMAAKRAAQRDLSIPPPAEPNRRRDCLADVYLLLETYFGEIFYQPFTPSRREMIDAIMHAARYGGDQAIVGPRGDGKTRAALFGSLALGLAGAVLFTLVIAKSGPRATRDLKNLKHAIRDSDPLAADFPELALPIRDCCRWPSKARQQTVHGRHTDLEWSDESIVLPSVPTELLRAHAWRDVPDDIVSAAGGQVTAALGIDGPIRGYTVNNRRPEVVILDDIDSRESARSRLQTATRQSIIEEDVGGLAGPDRGIARVFLGTPINRTCCAAIYSDPAQKPSWRPQRHQLLATKPEREDLWEAFIALRQQRAGDDPDARRAHQHYLDNRAAMDAGGVVTNPYRFDSRPLADGQPKECSALESCYTIIADRGWDHFATEYNCDPPQEAGPQSSGLTAAVVVSRLHGYPQAIAPPGGRLAIGIDVGMYTLHWTAVASNPQSAYFVIDYGRADVHGTSPGELDPAVARLEPDDPRRRMAIEQAILATLLNLRDHWIQHPYTDDEGAVIEPGLVPVDSGSGLHQPAVYEFCRQVGKPFVPAKGFGSGRGQSPFRLGAAKPGQRQIGEAWFIARQPQQRNIWLYGFDADYWKRFVHARWMTPTLDDAGGYRRGGLSLWRSLDSHRHAKFGRQTEAEIWVEDFEPGRGTRAFWDRRHKDNHWLDAQAMACFALSVLGSRVVGAAPGRRQRRSLADMQRDAGRTAPAEAD